MSYLKAVEVMSVKAEGDSRGCAECVKAFSVERAECDDRVKIMSLLVCMLTHSSFNTRASASDRSEHKGLG